MKKIRAKFRKAVDELREISFILGFISVVMLLLIFDEKNKTAKAV